MLDVLERLVKVELEHIQQEEGAKDATGRTARHQQE